ncbi:hypothetical protein N7517_010276 [Penicillium concentricum]|uniref:Uncharacterized protein n=1 Tax=Penicillium concentricum TaxID=293559 RepID=A0A9W9R8H2_9EURO|nr:uncharacterized protein N7517_010276 [Penicillium concentricum]KAJ5355667.1 hypothetical protein N7517_010276 [Penicillium concentricum]
MVKIELETPKQKIGHLPIDNFNVIISDVLPHHSSRTLGIRVPQKFDKAYTVNEVHHDEGV